MPAMLPSKQNTVERAMPAMLPGKQSTVGAGHARDSV